MCDMLIFIAKLPNFLIAPRICRKSRSSLDMTRHYVLCLFPAADKSGENWVRVVITVKAKIRVNVRIAVTCLSGVWATSSMGVIFGCFELP